MKTHRRFVLVIATALGIGLMASGGAFGHGWGHGYGHGGQGYQPQATWVQPDQAAGYGYRHRHFQGDTAPGPRAGYWGRRVQQAGTTYYGRRFHTRPRYGAWLGRPGKGPVPPPRPGECPNAQERQADDTET